MVVLKKLVHVIDNISEHSGVLGWLIIPMLVMMLYEVGARYAFSSPTIWANELTQLIFGVYFLIGGAYTLFYNGHVRMDVLLRRLSLRKQAICDLVTSVVFFFLLMFLLEWAGVRISWVATIGHRTTGSIWNAPIWPVKWGFSVAILLLMLQGVAKFIRSLHFVITGGHFE